MREIVISSMDIDHLALIRASVTDFMKSASRYADRPGELLDVAPQVHAGAKPFFTDAKISTLDIDPNSGATFIADICKNNSDLIPDGAFDWVVCTEVLEHTLNPFAAVSELKRVLKSGGLLFASSPFNFRIHGPLPDCWRFSEHGWKALMSFAELEIIELNFFCLI